MNIKKNIKYKEKYNLDDLTSIKIAKIIDLINEHLIKFYSLEEKEEPTPVNIELLIINKFKKTNSVQIEIIMNLMKDQGYCTSIPFEGENYIKEYAYTDKGLSLFFNGGLLREIRKKKNERLLIRFGQISIILAGLYYLKEIIKELITFFCK